MNEQVSERPQEQGSRRRNVLLGLGGGALVVAFCCIAAIVAMIIFAILDPFGWIGRLLGGGAGAASVMPAEASMYVSLDLARLRSEEVDGLVATFAQAVDSDIQDLDALLQDLDEDLDRELGLTISQDVLPWVGQYAGFSLLDVQLGAYGDLEEARWVLALEVRDRKGADGFIERFKQVIEEDRNGTFEQSVYEGVTLHTLSDGAEGVAIARSSGYVLIGPTQEALEAAIDATRGESLADLDAYQEAVAPLPRERILTIFFNMAKYMELLQSALGSSGLGSPFGGLQSASAGNAAMSISIVDEGIQIEGASVLDLESISEAQRQLLAAPRSPLTIDTRFPENTLFFAAGQHLDLGWEAVRASAAESGTLADFDESMQLLEDQIGIDLDKDLFPYLDGELAFGVFPSSTGLLPDQMGIPLGLLVLAETSQEEALRETVRTFSDHMRFVEFAPIEETTIGGLQAYELIDPFFETSMLAYGVDEGMLFMSTGADLIETAFAGGPSLAENEQYQATWRAFPQGALPAYYLDLDGFLGQIREFQPAREGEEFDQAVSFLQPIQVIAGASTERRGNLAQTTVIIFVDWSQPEP